MPTRQDQREDRPSPDYDPLTPEQRVLIGQMRPWLYRQIRTKSDAIDKRIRLWARSPSKAAEHKREIEKLTYDIHWMARVLESERGGIVQKVFLPYQQLWEEAMVIAEQRRQERVSRISSHRQSEARLNEAMLRLGVEPVNTSNRAPSRRQSNNQSRS